MPEAKNVQANFTLINIVAENRENLSSIINSKIEYKIHLNAKRCHQDARQS